MNLSAIAIRRPVFTVMVMVGLLVLGAISFTRLGTDLFPDVSFPVVVVNVPYPGAGPNEVETLVSKKIEDAVVSLNGIDRVRTLSREGLSTTIIFFTLDTEITEAATQVREKMAAVRYQLPRDVLDPTINRFDVSQSAILIYTLGGARSLAESRKYAEDVIKPALEQVDGVASVLVLGGAEREIRVELDRARIDALGLDPGVIVQQLQAANLTVPAGKYDQGTREVSVRTVGDLKSADDVRGVIVATAWNGSAVRLSDVAEVVDGYEDQETRIRVNGAEAVSFQVRKQSGENTVAVSERVQKKLAELEKGLPRGYDVELILDQARFIKSNAEEVEIAIVYGGAMAILIILLFMLDLRSTLISAVALPTSVVGTFILMYAFDFTLNMMTLLGLSLAIGLLIDDAVVVRENIFKHLERGQEPFAAALEGTKEIALSVFATTMTIVAVFLPVAFVGGMVGQFFRQFGITVSGAVLLSLFVAFTVDPMLSSRFSKVIKHGEADPWAAVKRPFEAFFKALDDNYRAILTWSVHHKLWVGAGAIGSLVLMFALMGIMGSEFTASEDRGQFVVDVELPAGTSLEESARLSKLGEDLLLKNREVRTVFSTIGPDGDSSRVKWRVVTSPKMERDIGIAELKDVARRAAQTMPDAKVSVTDPPFVEGADVEAPIMINVRGIEYPDIEKTANEIAHVLETTPGVGDVRVKYTPGRPELQVKVDQQAVADAKTYVAAVAMALRTAVEGQEAGKIRDGEDEVPIVVRLRAEDRADASALSQMTLRTPKGLVKLSDVAEFEHAEGPQVIERESRSRQIQVWATPTGRSLGEIVAEIQPRIGALKLAPGTNIFYDGQIRLMNETNSNMGIALLLGVIFIYIVLASQFESFIHPITIMLTLPLAMVGAVLALFLTGNTMAMGALIGIILLMGLVTKNAILLIDRAIVRVREHDETPLQAILEAGPERLRPILMTSAAMVLGMLPTAVMDSEGSEFRAPMAIAIIGGVVSSTILSLVVVPAFYLGIETLKGWLGIGHGKLAQHAPRDLGSQAGSPAD
ncbi:efflux RND transporter permease subunit [Myxococcota bacterium]|nr:efflux RND transporter permease subunit [Myxococcota bacterium]